MSAVFADAFYFLARLNPGDESHEQAVRVGTQETLIYHVEVRNGVNHRLTPSLLAVEHIQAALGGDCRLLVARDKDLTLLENPSG